MKTKFILLAIGSSLLLAAPALLAQNNLANNSSGNLGSNSSTNLGSNSSTNLGSKGSTNLGSNDSSDLGNNDSSDLGSNVSTSTTSTVTNAQTRRYQRAVKGEQLLLPAGITQKLRLTDDQKKQIKQIEEDFANTSQEYTVANQPRLDAANEANRQARAAKDKAQIQAARAQLQQVWAGLQPYRVAAVTKIKPLLTADQLRVLEDPKNQWRENYADEANDPAAN